MVLVRFCARALLQQLYRRDFVDGSNSGGWLTVLVDAGGCWVAGCCGTEQCGRCSCHNCKSLFSSALPWSFVSLHVLRTLSDLPAQVYLGLQLRPYVPPLLLHAWLQRLASYLT